MEGIAIHEDAVITRQHRQILRGKAGGGE